MKSDIMLFIFQIINFLTEFFSSFKVLLNKVYKAVSDVYLGLDSIWYFIPEHSLPLPAKSIADNTSVSWSYNSAENTLSYLKGENDKLHIYKISWLSASIVINDTIHAIDDFISSLKIHATPDYSPSTSTIINSWCINSNIWYSTTDTVNITIIDENGDDVVIDLNSSGRKFTIKHDCIGSLKHLHQQSTEEKSD